MRASALLVPAFVATLVASACSNQGEGDFCDSNNGSNDCETGLVCIAAPGLSGAGLVNRDRCCPVAPAQPTTSVCALNTANVIDASTGVPDAFANGVPDTGAGSPEAGSVAETGAPDTGIPDTGAPDAALPPAEAGPMPDAAVTDGSPE